MGVGQVPHSREGAWGTSQSPGQHWVTLPEEGQADPYDHSKEPIIICRRQRRRGETVRASRDTGRTGILPGCVNLPGALSARLKVLHEEKHFFFQNFQNVS